MTKVGFRPTFFHMLYTMWAPGGEDPIVRWIRIKFVVKNRSGIWDKLDQEKMVETNVTVQSISADYL
jgi:hypothetical protein